MIAQFEQKMKAVVRNFERVCEQLDKEPLLPTDVCQEVAREVGIAALLWM
jgi:hypothetical protein